MFDRRAKRAEQQEMWVVRKEIVSPRANGFYRKLDETLKECGFAEEIWKVCMPHYAEADKGGRPGIDPAVYFKMLETVEAVHAVILRALRQHGLLRGRQLGIDSSVIEANASLRALEHRNTEQSYWDYVKKLAEEAGIDPADTKAVRRFDKQRGGRKTSNQEWVNPHDPEAKVGRTKHGATDMVYKPEQVSDLESGAIIRAEVRPGNAGDTEALSERVAETIHTLGEVCAEEDLTKLGKEVCADEGYFALREIAQLQAMEIRAVISDPQSGRGRKNLPPEDQAVLRRAQRAVTSASGKKLLRKRGEHLERGFCHVLDHGGRRRATLRGCENQHEGLLWRCAHP
jgi:hypothetical protein